jgi:hypothetical protein
MKKLLTVGIVVVVTLALLASPAMAKGKNGPAGNSNTGHLYLYEKDSATWDIVPDGAWGKMKYNLSGSTFDFVFNGHGLEQGYEYTLIYYPDPWPGDGLISLGAGTVNEEGNIHIMGKVDSGDMPAASDLNHPDNGGTGTPPLTGAKIWLVLTGDIDGTEMEMIGWTPSEYLFEYNRIFFDTD